MFELIYDMENQLNNIKETIGIINYQTKEVCCVLELPKQFGDYYYSLIPKYKNANKTRYHAHLTIVRAGKEIPPNMEKWLLYQGEHVTIEYDNIIQESPTYFYLNAYSKRIGEIRRELGLPEYRKGFDCYHITVGNRKT